MLLFELHFFLALLAVILVIIDVFLKGYGNRTGNL